MTLRQIEVTGGSGPVSAPLTWLGSSPSTAADSSHLSCTDPAGNDVAYRLTGNSYSPTDSLAATTALVAEVVASPAVGPDVDVFSLGSFGSKTNDPVDVSFDMSAPDASVTLGTLAKNNIPPIANAGGGTSHTYGGNEGSPITFDGSGSSSVCGFPTLRWDFSDGGVAFGKNPQHTFQGPGTYSGLMTATDATGLTSTSTFSIEVGNLAPVVGAGPDTTAAWGRSVAFNGSATDPGKDDQSTLTYSWSFGDGSPSASGGPSVTHAYTTPGDYTATFTACDRWTACASSTRIVHVIARTVSVGYLGDTAGTYDTAGTLRASLVDQFGANVSGRSITFAVNGAAAGSSVTRLGRDRNDRVHAAARCRFVRHQRDVRRRQPVCRERWDREHRDREESQLRHVHRRPHRGPEQDHHAERDPERRDGQAPCWPGDRVPARHADSERNHERQRRGPGHPGAQAEEREVPAHGHLDAVGCRRESLHR